MRTMQVVYSLMKAAIHSDVLQYYLCESGTGKELIAREFMTTVRERQAFIPIDCGAR